MRLLDRIGPEGSLYEVVTSPPHNLGTPHGLVEKEKKTTTIKNGKGCYQYKNQIRKIQPCKKWLVQ